MNIIIGKEENTLFEKGAIYDCVIKGEINEQLYYKVYGDEFTLSNIKRRMKESRNFEFYKKYDKISCIKRSKEYGTCILY